MYGDAGTHGLEYRWRLKAIFTRLVLNCDGLEMFMKTCSTDVGGFTFNMLNANQMS